MPKFYAKQLLQLIVIYDERKGIELDEKSANHLIDESHRRTLFFISEKKLGGFAY